MKAILTSAPEGSQELRDVIKSMDRLSQSGFAEISAIAKLALSRLETPDGYRHLDDIACALTVIRRRADVVQNDINAEAEQVGCNHVDDAQRRRWDAQRAHSEERKTV